MDDERSMSKMGDVEKLRYWWGHIPNLFHGKFRKEWLKAVQKKSMRAAVNAKCADCMCWQNTEIGLCDIITCPLWQYRPLQKRESKWEAEVRANAAEIARTITEGSLE